MTERGDTVIKLCEFLVPCIVDERLVCWQGDIKNSDIIFSEGVRANDNFIKLPAFIEV